jgi:hypothetical protein
MIPLAVALTAACNEARDDDELDSDGFGGTGTSGDADDDDSGVKFDVGITSLTGLDDGVGSEGGEGGGGSTEDDAGGDGDAGSDPPDPVGCISPLAFLAIDRHLQDLRQTAQLVADHPSANQPVGFLLAPALPMPPATPIRFANVTGLPCALPHMYAPVCDGAHCYQVECSGQGTAWMTLLWNEEPVDAPDWDIGHVLVLTAWNDAEPGLEFAIASDGRSVIGDDASMIGYGRIVDGGYWVVEHYPSLHSYGETELTYVWQNEMFSGEMTIGSFVVARIDETGALSPTGVCPEPET